MAERNVITGVITRVALPTLSLLFLALSCREPATYEVFAPEKGEGVYEFPLKMTDSLAAYDISFYTRSDFSALRDSVRSLQFDVTWVAPDSVCYCERVFFPYPGPGGAREMYRSGVVPEQKGVWTLRVEVSSAPAKFRGLGIIVTRKDGTR